MQSLSKHQWHHTQCPTLCDPMDCSTPEFPVLHHFLEFTQSKVKSLFCNRLSRFFIAFIPRSKRLLLFVAVVTVHRDFRAPQNKICYCFHFFPHLFAVMWWDLSDGMPQSSLFKCWVLSQLFHSPLSSLSRNSLVPLCFLPLEWYHLHIWGCWYFSQQSWFQLGIHPAWHFTWCTLHKSLTSKVTIYSLDIVLSWYWTSPLFYVRF